MTTSSGTGIRPTMLVAKNPKIHTARKAKCFSVVRLMYLAAEPIRQG
jgi:hypothetical protein